MNVILLSGGSGKRLWPLSNDIHSKQFLKIFKTYDGSSESMLQQMYRGIRAADKNANVTIATGRNQVAEIRAQLGGDVRISVEPCRRDTFPAIALAVSYLHDVQKVDDDEPVVVCPVDAYVDHEYFQILSRLSDLAAQGEANLTLLGIEPTYAAEKYGYIIPDSGDEVSRVKAFKEKPDAQQAEKYLQQGALWNGGIFAFQLSYMRKRIRELLGFNDYNNLFLKYDSLEKTSFDYAVVEKEPSINVLHFHGRWDDLGTWDTLTEAMNKAVIGNGREDESCENTSIINNLGIPILAMGLKNTVIVASKDGILVTEKSQSPKIKAYLNMPVQTAYKNRGWGNGKGDEHI